MTDKSAAAIRRFAKKYKAGYILPEIKNGVLEFENKKDAFISDLTALVEEHYVSREEYDEEKKSNSLLHKAMVTAEKGGHDKAMEEISEHYYPKEFVEWMIKNEVFMGFPFERNNEGKLILSDTRDMTTKSAVFTTDELFNYWRENVQ